MMRRLRDQRTIGARSEWRCGAAIAVIVLCAPACNALLDIDVAELACAGGCDAGAGPLEGAPLPSLGGGAAEGANGGDMSAVTFGDAGASSPPVMTYPASPSEAIGAPPAGGGSSVSPLPVNDAGASAPVPVPDPGDVVVAATGPARDPNGFAVALPNDLIGAPVSGEIIFSEEAQWEVDGVFRPTFEIHTPTASYWIVKSLGTMVSMQDAYAGQSQWIDFSSGFRPLRNIPALDAPPAAVTTVLDRDSQTPTHLRLTSDSADSAWHWVWDFYITHATFTLDRAPGPIGFSYRGVPAGALGVEDQLIQSDGTAQGARNSFAGDLLGPVEWVYIADSAARRSLFLMQHTDDALPETYQVRDNDSAVWVFGGGQITALPIRFSLGLLDSVDPAVVSQRVAYVAGAIH
jgi:hypothetical protein